MKNFILFFLAVSALSGAFAFAGFSTIARCTSGGSLSGVELGMVDGNRILRIQVQLARGEDRVYLADISQSEAKAVPSGDQFSSHRRAGRRVSTALQALRLSRPASLIFIVP